MKKTLRDLDVSSKKVICRVDFNVPLKGDVITDENRIVQALPTIKYLIENNAKVILCSHLGRVKTDEDKIKNTLAPVAKKLAELLGKDVTFVNQTRGAELEEKINSLKDGEVLLFENTRFEAGETKNDSDLSSYWASLGDLFVNDAFGTAHRAHASNVGIASKLDSAAGFLLEKEINFLGDTIENPKRDFVAILGGSKVSDKIGVIENLLKKADKVLIGGGMAYTFFKALGKDIGTSLCEEDKLDLAKSLYDKANGKIILPVDSLCADGFKDVEATVVNHDEDFPSDLMGLDIGPNTVKLFNDCLQSAKTVVWNGPMGVFEFNNFNKGTIGVCEAIANLNDATTIIGGGDSAAAAIQLGFADKFSHISTGGGASLEYLEGKPLPGLESLSEK